MSREKLQQLVGSLAKSIENGERVATPLLAAKLAKAVVAYPGDQTLGAMSRVIGKMADNNTLFITKADLKGLYTKLYSRNTKFAELFQDELGVIENLKGATTFPRDDSSKINPYNVGDQVLANALQSVFDKHTPVKMYSQALAEQAKVSVGSTLDAWSLRPTHLTIDDGNEQFIVIKADYETPKGLTSFYVPVEINKGKIVEASVFMGNSGPQELNNTSVKSYLTTFTGNKLNLNGTSILQVLTKAATEHREVSDAEIALTKLNASRQGKSEFFQNQIVGQKIAEASKKEVQLPKSDEFKSFEEQFTSSRGLAEFHLGASIVNAACEHVAREIIGFGFKNPQVVVQGFDKHSKTNDSTIYLNIALNDGRIGFAVPVRVANGKIVKPAVLLCNGSVDSFSQDALERLCEKNTTDFKAAAVASPQFALKPSDLLNNIRKAVAEGNHAQAEDALNVLSTAGDEKAYATGFQLFMDGLSNKKEAVATPCNMIMKNSTSQHPICGHTGLPLHKVYQDKDGNCRPLFRRGMEETYEGATFITSKIFG